MHLQRADELRAGHVPEAGRDRVVAVARVELPQRRRERVDAGDGEPSTPFSGRRGRVPRGGELRDRLAHGRHRRRVELELRGRELELGVRHLGGDGGKVERDRIEEHHFLLEPDRERLGRVEDLAQAGHASALPDDGGFLTGDCVS